MNKEIKKRWIEALRSKQYQQGKYQLRTETQDYYGYYYCCLGVLTHLYAREKGCSWNEACDGNKGYLPYNVRVWAGLDLLKNPINLAKDNDDGKNFDWIADKIEREL